MYNYILTCYYTGFSSIDRSAITVYRCSQDKNITYIQNHFSLIIHYSNYCIFSIISFSSISSLTLNIIQCMAAIATYCYSYIAILLLQIHLMCIHYEEDAKLVLIAFVDTRTNQTFPLDNLTLYSFYFAQSISVWGKGLSTSCYWLDIYGSRQACLVTSGQLRPSGKEADRSNSHSQAISLFLVPIVLLSRPSHSDQNCHPWNYPKGRLGFTLSLNQFGDGNGCFEPGEPGISRDSYVYSDYTEGRMYRTGASI